MEPGGSSFFRKMGMVVLYYKIKPLSSQPCGPDADCYGSSQILYDRMELLALESVPGKYLEISRHCLWQMLSEHTPVLLVVQEACVQW